MGVRRGVATSEGVFAHTWLQLVLDFQRAKDMAYWKGNQMEEFSPGLSFLKVCHCPWNERTF